MVKLINTQHEYLMVEKDDRLYNFTIYDQLDYEIHKLFVGILNKTQEISFNGIAKITIP